MIKILVTGGAGFLGSSITRVLLNNGYYVRVIDNGWRNCDNLATLCRNKNFDFISGDILNHKDLTKAKTGIDKVIHLAGLVGQPACDKHYWYGRFVNELGTWNVINVGGKIPTLFFSSGSVLGSQKDVADEQSIPNPVSQYAVSKLIGEGYVSGRLELCNQNDLNRYKESDYLNKDNIIYRLATVMGVSYNIRTDLLPNDLTLQAFKNKSITVFQADFLRSFIDVEDIADSVLFAINNWESLQSGLYNIANENGNWSKRQLAEFISKNTNCLINYGSDEIKDVDSRNYLMSTQLMKSKGWEAKIPMEESMRRLLLAVPMLASDLRYKAI